MLTAVLCFCLALASSAQLYSSTGLGNYGYPGTYGNMMGLGSNYMGNYSPYGSPYGMSGFSGGMNGLYGHNMLANGMGLGSYGMASGSNKPFLPVAPIQPVRSQTFGFFGSNGIDPNCFH